jgi:hypothetical protein
MHEGTPATQSRSSCKRTACWCILEESDDFFQRLCWVSGAPDSEAPGGRQSDRDGEVRVILDAFQEDMLRTGANYQEMFKKVKNELARKYKAVL